MKVTSVRDESVSIRSEIRNAFIDLSEMTLSAVAVSTDFVRGTRSITICSPRELMDVFQRLTP
jgi:hypothetical protein